jgi:hypothetical protein
MCVGGPPKPVQPSRSQWVAMVASDTLSRVTARLPSSTEHSLWNRLIGSLPNIARPRRAQPTTAASRRS